MSAALSSASTLKSKSAGVVLDGMLGFEFEKGILGGIVEIFVSWSVSVSSSRSQIDEGGMGGIIL